MRPGAGQTNSEYVAICTSSTLAKVSIGQVTTSASYTFAKTFMWPAAAGQLGAWSVCSYQTAGSESGQMATIIQYYDFTVIASPTPTPTPRPPTATPTPIPQPPTSTPTARPTRTGTATPAPTATLLATTPAATTPLATLPKAAPPRPPSGPPLGLLLLAVLLLGLMLLGGWGALAVHRRRHPTVTPPPPFPPLA